MADTYTTQLNLTKPEVGASSDTWGTKLNADMDAIDALFDAGPVLKLSKGGTGAATAAGARTALGLGDIATQAANAVAITGGSIQGLTTLKAAAVIESTSGGFKFPDGSVQTTAGGGGGGSSLTYTTKTTNFTAVAGTAYLVNFASGTITLPASPADNDYVVLVDLYGSATPSLTVGRNGKKIMGLTADMTITQPYFAIKLVYNSANGDWRIAI